MKILKDAAIVVAAVTLAVVTAGVAAGASFAFAFGALASTVGVSTAVLGGVVAAGAVAALGSILPHPSQGGSQTKWKADPYAGSPYTMGRTGTSGNIVGKRGSGGKNKYEHFVTVLSVGGPIKAIEASFANRTTVHFDSSGVASGTYHDLIWQVSQLGTCPEAAAMVPARGNFPDWTPNSKLSGIAATLVTMEYDASGKNQLTTEPQMFWIIQGVLVYDPRLDSTYPGGAGPCRAFNESTYVYSEDPHLHGLTFAMGRYQNGKRVAGIGATLAEIDVASFVEGANLNEARGWKIGGQVVSRPDTPWNSLKSILQAGGAQPVMVGGVIVCLNRAPRVSLATITASDIVGDCSFSGTQPRRTRINGVIPMYRSESHDWEYVSAAGIIVADYVAIDGDERTKEIQYSLVQDVDQASQLARYDIEDAREAGPGTVPLGPFWLNYRVGDCVTFNPEDGFLVKCIIFGREIDAQNGTVTYTLRSETDAKHPFALGQTGQAPPTASLAYDPSVEAPSPDAWSISGATLASSAGSVPAIIVAGAVEQDSVSSVIFDLRLHVAGQDDETGWETQGDDDAGVQRKVITSVSPLTDYDVSVRYVVRGVTGERLILGPATAGTLSTSSAAHAIRTQSVIYPLTSDDDSISVAAFTGVIDDGRTINFPAATIPGLAASTFYGAFWRSSTSGYEVEVSPAVTRSADAGCIFIAWQATSDDGTYPANTTAPGGYGGSGAAHGGEIP